MMAYNNELVDRVCTVRRAIGKYAIICLSSATAENVYYYLFVLFDIVITKTRHPQLFKHLGICTYMMGNLYMFIFHCFVSTAGIFYKIAYIVCCLPHHRPYHTIPSIPTARDFLVGHIVTTGYKIPKGDWFDYVCCPQYFAESVIYVTIGLVLGCENVTWWALAGYVATNQLYLAYSARCWYRQKFEAFPRDRKMIIPYIL